MKLKFPEGFIWGTAISAFQTEMGSSEGSVYTGTDWYEWANSEDIINEGLVSGDRPQDGIGFWDFYEDDMRLARSLGNNAIRMSIEWARIFNEPTFSSDARFAKNEKGEPISFDPSPNLFNELKSIADIDALDHYSRMIDFAHSLGLKVFMTLYHWPLPLWLHRPVECHKNMENTKEKGWLDTTTVEEFAKYAFFISKTLGTKVESWETINEPEVIATNGYILGSSSGFPPGIDDVPSGFKAERNLALAHNLAYRILKKNTGREVGIGTAPPYFEPATHNPEDVQIAETARYLNNEWIMNAALKGEFDNSLSGVPDEKIRDFGGSDYVGIDYYSRMRVKYSEEDRYAGSLPMKILPCSNCSDFKWDIYPEGIRLVSHWIYDKYKLPIYILENGIADREDKMRAKFIIDHLIELNKAINEDGIPVKGYFHWSLMDNFEWARGYSMKFGLYYVDIDSKKRIKRDSALIYEKICRGESLD
ncbi:MAG: glycoside hydrolase family 1 protein [Candidatus Parvarchaeota archaeon]